MSVKLWSISNVSLFRSVLSFQLPSQSYGSLLLLILTQRRYTSSGQVFLGLDGSLPSTEPNPVSLFRVQEEVTIDSNLCKFISDLLGQFLRDLRNLTDTLETIRKFKVLSRYFDEEI